MGGARDLTVDVRFIAATNRDLEQEVAAGRFRLDLFHRLNVFQLTVPALRKRREDIPHLARWLLDRVAQRLGRACPRLSAEAAQVLVAYDYPGNVRELRNVLERALILESGPEITPASLILGDRARAPSTEAQAFFAAELSGDGRPPTLAELEKQYVERLLRYARWNRAEVARLLKVSYPTVAKKIADYGIKVPD